MGCERFRAIRIGIRDIDVINADDLDAHKPFMPIVCINEVSRRA
jgi:hypothetical protein